MSHQGPPYLHRDREGWLLKRIAPEPMTGCWIFTGVWTEQNYGFTRFGGKKLLAHRLAYQEFVGSIPEGMCVLHRCDNPPCINPKHLYLGSNEDNVRDRVARGRSWRKIAPDVMADILVALAAGERQIDISQRFGISEPYLSMIKHGNRSGVMP